MSENKMGEDRLREPQEITTGSEEAIRTSQSSGHLVWKIVGGAVLALAATALITSLNDIRRYIRISRM